MKQYHFLCSVPRSGVTLLSSILNQSKQLQVTPNSILPQLLINLQETKNSIYFKNFPYHKGINNIIKKLFDTYYSDINTNVILDRAPWGTPWNLNTLKTIFKKRKFVIIYRPPLECLASLIKSQNTSKVSKDKIIDFCHNEMNKFEGYIGKSIWAIKNIVEEKEEHIIINYIDLITDTKNQIKKIYKFLNLKQEKLDLKNIKQFEFANMRYDDSMFDKPIHTIRKNKIEQVNYDIEKYLPKSIIDKYKDC
tara:strand:- start:14 stop:763 length:750 start_codon:yes stop_codon:yes gene_type:complete